MKLGLLITMYDEFESVADTIDRVGYKYDYIGITQSGQCRDDGVSKRMDCRFRDIEGLSGVYDILPDLGPHYSKWELPAQALCRNIAHLFDVYKKKNEEHCLDIDNFVVITGDTLLLHNWGIDQIVRDMTERGMPMAVSVATGQDFHRADKTLDELKDGGGGGRLQTPGCGDFMPQMFIVNSRLVDNFISLEVTNVWCSEQCLGDAVLDEARHLFATQAFSFSDGVVYHWGK